MAETEILELLTSRKRRKIIIEDGGIKTSYEMIDLGELTLSMRAFLMSLINSIKDVFDGKLKQDDLNSLESDLAAAIQIIVPGAGQVADKLSDEQRLQIINAFSSAQAQPAVEGAPVGRPENSLQ